VSQKVDHPRREGLEPDEPLPEISQKSDQDLDRRLVRVLLEPPGMPDFTVRLKKLNTVRFLKEINNSSAYAHG
jgi:hypothetical protein